jgi:hypothetical protein
MLRFVRRHLTRCASQLANYLDPDKFRDLILLSRTKHIFYNMVWHILLLHQAALSQLYLGIV